MARWGTVLEPGFLSACYMFWLVYTANLVVLTTLLDRSHHPVFKQGEKGSEKLNNNTPKVTLLPGGKARV